MTSIFCYVTAGVYDLVFSTTVIHCFIIFFKYELKATLFCYILTSFCCGVFFVAIVIWLWVGIFLLHYFWVKGVFPFSPIPKTKVKSGSSKCHSPAESSLQYAGY